MQDNEQAIHSGDTIAYPIQLPIYGIGRVVTIKGDGWYSVRRFDLPGVLNERADDLRIERPINLRNLLPQHGTRDIRSGDYAVALAPAGARIVTVLHDVKGDEPAVLVRDGGRFNFAEQREVPENFAVPLTNLMLIEDYLKAK
jgi:hypothetical protein